MSSRSRDNKWSAGNRPSEKGPAKELRVIQGMGAAWKAHPVRRDEIASVIASVAADMMLRRISPLRAHEIQVQACRVLRLFDEAGAASLESAEATPELQKEARRLERMLADRRRAVVRPPVENP